MRTVAGLSALVLLTGCGAPSLPTAPLPAPHPAAQLPAPVSRAPASPAPASPAPARGLLAAPAPLSAGRALIPPRAGIRELSGGLGLSSVYEYVNERADDCGPAAAATLLVAAGLAPRDPDLARELYARYPPDVAGGRLGSSPRQVVEMLGVEPVELSGTGALRAALAEDRAVLVLLDLTPLGRGPGAHWSVVVGMSDTSVQLTNLSGGELDLASFERAWRGSIPTLAGVAGRGLVLPIS